MHGYNVTLSYDDPYLGSLINREKRISFGTYDITESYKKNNSIDKSGTLGGLDSYPIAWNNIKVFFNDYDINPSKVENSGEYHYSYRNFSLRYSPTVSGEILEAAPSFTTTNFVVKKNGEALFGEVPSFGLGDRTPTIDFSPRYNYEVLEPQLS